MNGNQVAAGRRRAEIERRTRETSIRIALDLDGGERRIETPDGFLSHMFEALATHAGFGIDVTAEGDTHVDLHHTAEDLGICFGEALAAALGARQGITRFATAYAPLDEALARAVVDLSGRGHLTYVQPPGFDHAWISPTFPLALVQDVFAAIADRGRLTLHLDVLRGRNPHHLAEASFKALALALRTAVVVRGGDVPSTKGSLTA
jgi:imidazoleglycerol-phosphate dehydratase